MYKLASVSLPMYLFLSLHVFIIGNGLFIWTEVCMNIRMWIHKTVPFNYHKLPKNKPAKIVSNWRGKSKMCLPIIEYSAYMLHQTCAILYMYMM